jgi:TIR domain
VADRPGRDFFISYTAADRAWAEWVAWQLEAAGWTTVLQAWDFAVGENFVLRMRGNVNRKWPHRAGQKWPHPVIWGGAPV